MSKKGNSSDGRTALYRKYRSRSLDEVVGQSQVTDILRRGLAQGKIAHAYLLTGPRGVGKTSIARILAHEINQLPYGSEDTHLDIIEIDAASNNGVDDVRDLREKVQLAPISAAKKVYIIDEVHMLSKPAFNALLKTLEEPPAHVVFILATTDLHKVPATIISRTQHFAFHAISQVDLVAHLKSIAKSEGINVSDAALDTIATRGDGSFRDSISLLDQLSSFADDEQGITLEIVQSALGLASSDAVASLLTAVTSRDVAGVISQLDTLEKEGIQPVILADQLISAVRSRLAEHPQTVTLLDALLSVSSSSQSQLKLLTVLVGAIKPKTVAAHVSRQPVTIIEAPLPSAAVQEPVKVSKAATTKTPKPIPAVQSVGTPKPAATVRLTPLTDIDWPKLIEYTRTNLIALHSVLSKTTYELDGDTLTIYAGRKFNKTKLDQAKYLTQLHEALSTLGADGLTIVTVGETQPPADEQLARVAAMMGGGQEVILDEPVGEQG